MERTNTKTARKPRKKRALDLPPVAVADAVGVAASHEYTHAVLGTRGAAKAVKTLVGRGVSTEEAIAQVAARAKGHMGEIDLATSLTARSGLVGRAATARPNPLSTHPTDDILLGIAGRTTAAAQIKNGSTSYVSAAITSGQYEGTMFIANTEAVAALEQAGAVEKGLVPSRLSFGGIDSCSLSAADTRARTAEVLGKVMSGARFHDRIAPFVIAAKAGVSDGIQTLGLNLVVDLVEAVATGGAFDFEAAFTRSAKVGAKVALRNGAVTWSQVTTFLARAKGAFSARLIHRITSSTFAMSAVADVVIETAFDLVEVYRGRMDWDTLLRNLGVNTLTAAGGLGGAILGAAVAGSASWPVALVAIFLGMWLGAKGGRLLGEHLFDGEAEGGWQPA
jgi:hypothetical protein